MKLWMWEYVLFVFTLSILLGGYSKAYSICQDHKHALKATFYGNIAILKLIWQHIKYREFKYALKIIKCYPCEMGRFLWMYKNLEEDLIKSK